jgi:alpha-methylacyl-CoA racemase
MTASLNGLRIIDFTSMVPGPLATFYLADMGAAVLKIVFRSRPIVHKLIMHYDILMEQLRPGIMTRAVLDDKTLRLGNPTIICCSITSYG